MKAVVIGAGLGGLSAAIGLAARGVAVTVLEAGPAPGGKAGTVLLEGVEVDTGPSVLTMPEVLEPLLHLGGRRLGVDLVLREPRPAFRYLYPDGACVDVYASAEETLESVARALGAPAQAELAAFLAYARRIWEAAAPHFVYGAAPSVGRILSLGLRTLASLTRIDPLRSMKTAIDRQVSSPHLRRLLYRYATYNGSDVRRAPATLSCIAHVELALGGFGVEGGIAAMVRVLVDIAEHLGVELRTHTTVEQIRRTPQGTVAGVTLRGGESIDAAVVVANADPALVMERLLPPGTRHGLSAPEASMSGWNAVLRARRSPAAPRVAHTVLFCDDYPQEFADIFDRDRPPQDPTVYLCAQEVCHGRSGWPDAEPVFVMANAPAEPSDGTPRDPATWAALEVAVRHRLETAGLCHPDDRLIWRRTPADLAARFPGSRGSIYGGASNDMFSAFTRPPNRISRVPGLYMASGGAHPGGGMPLAMLSGQAAVQAIAEDHALPLPASPQPSREPSRWPR